MSTKTLLISTVLSGFLLFTAAGACFAGASVETVRAVTDCPGTYIFLENSVSMNAAAHELGHALGGLEHADPDSENLMTPGGDGLRLREGQWDSCNQVE